MPSLPPSVEVPEPIAPLAAFADVVVPRRLHQSFTYRVPSHLQQRVTVGSRVSIPFGPSIVQGVVVSLSTTITGAQIDASVSAKGLRDILSTLGRTDSPDLDHDLLDLARFVSDHYLAPLGQCVRLVLPPDGPATRTASYVITDSGRNAQRGGERLSQTFREVLDRLAASPKGLTLATLKRNIGGSVASALRHLGRRQWVEQRAETAETSASLDKSRGRRRADHATSGIETQAADLISDPQRLPVVPASWHGRLTAALDSAGPSSFLLRAPARHRIACLLQIAEETVNRRRSVLMVTGEISGAALLGQYAKIRWGNRAEVLHSGLSSRARAEVWHRIQGGSADVVVGTRSAVFAPLRSLGLVCVEAEEETSLKEQQEPRYHAREVAWRRACQNGAVLLLGSAHPSVETLKAVEAGTYSLTLPETRIRGPIVQAIDLRQLPYGTVLSESMLTGIEAALSARAGVLLYHNRKGFAPLLTCRDCGNAPRCPQCRVSFTYYRQMGRLTCHYCGSALPAPDACPACLATRFAPVGFGTERLEEEIRRHFPGARIARLDRDRSQPEAEARLTRRQAWAGAVDILIGTRMLLHGAPLPKAGFVGIPLADAGLHLPDFRAAERTYHSLMDAVGLARSADEGGRALVQTYLPSHHVIKALVEGNPGEFYDQELAFRRTLVYPPYSTLIGLRVSGTHAERVHGASKQWAQLLREAAAHSPEAGEISTRATGGQADEVSASSVPPILVLGPIPAFLNKIRRGHSCQLMVKSEDAAAVRHVVKTALRRLEGQREWRGLKFEVDVDPIEM